MGLAVPYREVNGAGGVTLQHVRATTVGESSTSQSCANDTSKATARCSAVAAAGRLHWQPRQISLRVDARLSSFERAAKLRPGQAVQNVLLRQAGPTGLIDPTLNEIELMSAVGVGADRDLDSRVMDEARMHGR